MINIILYEKKINSELKHKLKKIKILINNEKKIYKLLNYIKNK